MTIEEAWMAVELVEKEKFDTDVRHLRPAVFAALGVGDEKLGKQGQTPVLGEPAN